MEDKELKELMLASKLKASENLKDRIIHQINAEKGLIPKSHKVKTSNGSYFYILRVMYLFLLILAAYFYFQTDGNPFQSQTFVISTLFIASTFSLYWFVNVYVDYRKTKV
ncbi:hypothetical protein ERX46_12100 [Brumimicrobium glaciale]|uniref:Uncharacterized protein n=1 Tax=Brumimicrobium glaciale TaxID=200475 RepID=A0A4Q4KLT3_9FLAO|nr:hypothetical protein [Brumimicrobium glaciale]RYM32799.1 hypothetical protein ERX46_12100 [Brumimicrobium glaciale]